MGSALRRIFQTIAWWVTLPFTVAKLYLDYTGRVEMYEDPNSADLWANGANWLFTTPSWVSALILIVLTALILLPDIKKQAGRLSSASSPPSAAQPPVPDPHAVLAEQLRLQRLTREGDGEVMELASLSLNKKEEAARRWIDLSKEIIIDLPHTRTDFPPVGPDWRNLDKSTQSLIWERETSRYIKIFQETTSKMNQKYLVRLQHSISEMAEFGILDKRISEGPLNLVNTFSWRDWAVRLVIEGKKILDHKLAYIKTDFR
jgi:hypothetical protein